MVSIDSTKEIDMDSLSFDVERFASTLTGRSESMFAGDIAANTDALNEKIRGKSAIVIGGAGTIGSNFVKAMLPFEPARVVVVDINENGLTELIRDLRSSPRARLPDDLRMYPIDLGDPVFGRLLANEGPFDIVANFAAHKHVRSEKDHYSIEAMVENNVGRAKILMDLLYDVPPSNFFCVSTDKATNPVNVMGASKSLMERIIMAYSDRFVVNTARFANVAFSNGSLLDGFLYRLRKRQPLSAPIDVRRYFVSPTESGQICLLSCMLGNSAEIFFPKLDEKKDVMTFSEIAERLVHELGMEPRYCESEDEARVAASQLLGGDAISNYPVYFFQSDTTGEKPFEEFYNERESVDFDRFKSLGVIQYEDLASIDDASDVVKRLQVLFNDGNADKESIVSLMKSFLPDFQHTETDKNLDQRM